MNRWMTCWAGVLSIMSFCHADAFALELQWHTQLMVEGGRIDAVASLGDGVILSGSRFPNAGHLFRSADGGETWEDLGRIFGTEQRTNSSVSSIASAGAGVAYVLIGSSQLWKTEDWGVTWADMGRIHNNDRLGPYLHSYSITVLDSGTLLVSDTSPTGGHVYRSVNGGADWQDLGAISSHALYRFANTDHGVLLNGWGGRVYASSDDGQTWQPSGQLVNSPLYATIYLEDGIALQGAENGHLFRSTDSGQTWQHVATPGAAADDFAYLGDGHVLYSTYTGTRHMFLSRDYGQSWTDIGPVPTGVPGDIMDHFTAVIDEDYVVVGGTKEGYMARIVGLTGPTKLTPPIGAWHFDDPNHLGKAAIGQDLLVDNTHSTIAAIEGPAGAAAVRIGLNDYMSLNRTDQPLLDEYSLVMDVRIPSDAGQWRAVLHTGHSDSNAHLWIDGNSGIMGHANLPGAFSIDSGYSTKGIERDKWYRVVFYGYSKPGNHAYFKFTVLDSEGNVVFTEHRYGIEMVDQQHALHELVRFFYSESNDVDHAIDVAGITLFDYVLPQGQAEALGAPGTVIPEPGSL